MQALVDSGADGNFTNSNYCCELQIPSTLLEEPIPATALDGWLLNLVTRHSLLVKIIASGNHCERLSLHLRLSRGFGSPLAPQTQSSFGLGDR